MGNLNAIDLERQISPNEDWRNHKEKTSYSNTYDELRISSGKGKVKEVTD